MTPSPWVPVLFAALLVTGCGSDDEDADKNTDPEGAKALLAEVQAGDYRNWARAPGYETRKVSEAPHGNEVDIFYDDVMDAAVKGSPISEWPVGATIAKDGYKGETLYLTALMQKREGGWFWAEMNGEGAPLFSGSPELCRDCHDTGDDFVRTAEFPK